MLSPPVILDNRGDIEAFASLDDALVSTEAVDVEAGGYEAFDRDGRLLTLGIEETGGLFGRKRVVVKKIEEPPGHGPELRERLASYMRRAGILDRDPGGDLPSLVARLLERQRESSRGRARTPWAGLWKPRRSANEIGPAAERMASVIRRWVAALPPGTAEVSEERLRFEHVVRIRPVKPGASGVEFRLGEYGGFGLYFGHAFMFEELPWSDAYAIEVLEAIRKGGFREEIWQWGRWTVRMEGELRLASGAVLYDRVRGGVPRWPCKKRVLDHQAWT